MKKSLIALAVLAASGAAMAQSTVTLYGIVDVWVGSQKDTGATNSDGSPNLTARERNTVMGSGGYNGNRFGLRGSEDLGGGLKANFVLEQGFTIDDGAQQTSGLQFNRAAWVGASGGFGEVRLGRQLTAYDTLRGATNNSFDSAFATTSTVFGRGVADYTNRVNNSIQYISPTMSGFTAAFTYGLGENKTAIASSTDVMALHVRYAAGPLLVGIAYQNEETRRTTAPLTNTPDRSYTLVAGSYNFGVATVTAGFNRAKQSGTGRDNEYQLGVNVPLSNVSSVALGYTRASLKNATGGDAGKASGLSLTGFYDLSKRTRLYAGINDTDTENASGVTTRETSLFAVGLRHSF